MIKERDYIEELFSKLPPNLKQEMLDLWDEFNDGQTPESCFARALDRFNPFLYMLQNGGESWQRNKITHEMALEKNVQISDGSKELWAAYQILAAEAAEIALFYK